MWYEGKSPCKQDWVGEWGSRPVAAFHFESLTFVVEKVK